MKVTTKGRYGIRALLDVALDESQNPIPLKAIAERQHIPLNYLERIAAVLVRAGVLQSTRGPAGGVRLAEAPEDICIGDIVRVLEGSTAPSLCVDDPDSCERSDICVMCDIWGEVKEAVDGILKSLTLQELVERHRNKLNEM